MESPEVNILGHDSSHHISLSKDVHRDDSGYVTVTPSSAETTGISADNSGSSALRRTLYLSTHHSDSRHKHSSLFTPEEKKSRTYRSKPKYLLRDSFTDNNCSSLDANFIFESNIVEARDFRCRYSLPILHEVNHEIAHGSLKCESKSQTSKKLKRQNAFSEDMEWSWDHETKAHHLSPESHTFVTNELQGLTVKDQGLLTRGQEIKNIYRNTGSSSDPCDYKYLPSIVYIPPECTSSSRDDKKPINVCDTGSETTTCISCPITPVKYRKKIRRLSPDETFRDSLTRTPEKLEDNFSPIFKPDTNFSERKSAKRLNFSSQKIGTPEKNQILYPQLKSVTPPKKIKSPEKIRKSALKTSESKCRKSLNFCGREHVDFLKMLQSYWPAIKCILSRLSCEDLTNVCQVSRTWKNVCQAEPEAERRRRRNAQHKERMKENLSGGKSKKYAKQLDSFIQSIGTVRRDLMEIQNHSNVMLKVPTKPRSPPVSPGKRRFNDFMKAASEDSVGELRSCPRCNRPARVRGQWATCGGRGCGNSFCVRCLTERLPNHPCCQRPIEAPSPSKQAHSKGHIGTKQSRRNLRRL